jgi:nucleoside-diphosphate-sugar epimerase
MHGPKVSISYGLANVLAWLVERFPTKSDFNRFSVYSTCVDSTFVHHKATRDFGYQPRFSAEEAFKITLEWLKTQEI